MLINSIILNRFSALLFTSLYFLFLYFSIFSFSPLLPRSLLFIYLFIYSFFPSLLAPSPTISISWIKQPQSPFLHHICHLDCCVYETRVFGGQSTTAKLLNMQFSPTFCHFLLCLDVLQIRQAHKWLGGPAGNEFVLRFTKELKLVPSPCL